MINTTFTIFSFILCLTIPGAAVAEPIVDPVIIDPVIIEEDVSGPSEVFNFEQVLFEAEDGQTYNSVTAERKEDGSLIQFVLVPKVQTFDEAYSTCASFGSDWRVINRENLFGIQMAGIYEMLEPESLGYDLGPSGYGSEDGGIIISGAGGTVSVSWFMDDEGYTASELSGTDNVYVTKGWDEEVVSLKRYIKRLRDFAENPEHPVYTEYYQVAADLMSEGVDLVCSNGSLLN